MAKITLEQLKQAKACSDQVKLFETTFGSEVEVTEEAAEEASSLFDFDWAAYNLLSRERLEEYERQGVPLWAEYERQVVPLWAEYERQKAPLLAEYERQVAPSWKEYDRQEASLWGEYDRQRAPLWAKYQRQMARLFARIYNGA